LRDTPLIVNDALELGLTPLGMQTLKNGFPTFPNDLCHYFDSRTIRDILNLLLEEGYLLSVLLDAIKGFTAVTPTVPACWGEETYLEGVERGFKEYAKKRNRYKKIAHDYLDKILEYIQNKKDAVSAQIGDRIKNGELLEPTPENIQAFNEHVAGEIFDPGMREMSRAYMSILVNTYSESEKNNE
jgi:hypothetical protein